jgi:hypothetical protein
MLLFHVLAAIVIVYVLFSWGIAIGIRMVGGKEEMSFGWGLMFPVLLPFLIGIIIGEDYSDIPSEQDSIESNVK